MLAPPGRHDQARLVGPGLVQPHLTVTGREVSLLGEDPDLEELDKFVRRGVVFAVDDTRAGGHDLDFARVQDVYKRQSMCPSPRP